MTKGEPAPDAADRFFEPASVQTIHLEILPEDLVRLNRALPERISVTLARPAGHCSRWTKAGAELESYVFLAEFIRGLDPALGGVGDLNQQFDLDTFLPTMAVMLLAGAFDQYTGWNPHNYYLYRHPLDRRWTYIPWDLDVGFADNAFGHIPVLEGWHAAWPAPVPNRPLMEKVVADPVLLERYRQQARDILETWFHPDILIPKLRARYNQIRSALAEDPFPAPNWIIRGHDPGQKPHPRDPCRRGRSPDRHRQTLQVICTW